MAVFVTGDIHGDASRFSSDNFPIGKDLTKDDYVIILGDFGLVWNKDEENKYEKNWLDWLEEKPWTTLFIDGNHENFDRLNAYPIEKWNSGMVQKIRPSVIHLMRGEIFDLQKYRFLAMGGAPSHDIQDGILEIGDHRIKEWSKNMFKMFRVNHLSWWAEEVPNAIEKENALTNLEKVNNKVDFILTHEAPASVINWISIFPPTEYSMWLERNIRHCVEYKHWYFGHYHLNKYINDKETCLYEQIRRIV